MKKTIVALMALTGVAMATETDTIPITLSATFTSEEAAKCPDGVSYDITINNLDKGNKSGGDYMTSSLRPDINMTSGSWTLTFTLKNDSSSAITLSSVNFDSFIFNAGGKQHGADDHTRQALFTLSQTTSDSFIIPLGSTVVTFTTKDDNISATDIWNTDADASITLSSALEIAAGESVKFSLTVGTAEGITNAGSFVGLKGVTFNGTTALIPEPTTATLSLLALAGLAARRRRR